MDVTEHKEKTWQRNTYQRRLLLELMQENGGHLDADELYQLARQRESSMSLSTVYRNLRLFKDLGLIEERHLTEEHHHYEVKPVVEHHHLVCRRCGKVIEFTNPLAEKLKQRVGIEEDFLITDAEIRIQGYCTECRRAIETADHSMVSNVEKR